MIFVVRCPRCKRIQLYKPRKTKEWRKKCVYCGYVFKINPKSKESNAIIVTIAKDITEARKILNRLKSL